MVLVCRFQDEQPTSKRDRILHAQANDGIVLPMTTKGFLLVQQPKRDADLALVFFASACLQGRHSTSHLPNVNDQSTPAKWKLSSV
jgi:hypothetical protein